MPWHIINIIFLDGTGERVVTYNYICDSCGSEVELDLPMAERNAMHRCQCGGLLMRLYHAVPHYWDGCEWPGGWRPAGTPVGRGVTGE